MYGPNGFLRAFRGSISGANAANLDLRVAYDKDAYTITLLGTNRGSQTVTIQVMNAYTGELVSGELRPGASARQTLGLEGTWGWYDFILEVEQDPTFRYQIAGHVESGRESMTDPAIAVQV